VNKNHAGSLRSEACQHAPPDASACQHAAYQGFALKAACQLVGGAVSRSRASSAAWEQPSGRAS
jgi:hypothetical protein